MVSVLARRQLLVALAAMCLLLLSDSSTAHPPTVRDAGYRVTLEDEWGRPLSEYFFRGETFVLGQFGDRYQISIENPSSRRVEAVVSVDGRDAISGRRADYAHQRGYLVPAYGTVVVTGFRRSLDAVAAFRFTTPEDSYSSRMGTPENVGVIGVAFFAEAQPRYPTYPKPLAETRHRRPSTRGWPEGSRGDRAPAPTSKSAPRDEAGSSGESRSAAPRRYSYDDADGWRSEGRLGTEYGETQESSVVEVPFRRASTSRPQRIVIRRYDDRNGLLARGIDVDGEDDEECWCRGPEAFPDSRFAPPPP